MTCDFSQRLREILEEASWYPGRDIGDAALARVEATLAAAGYQVSDAARAFLREFDGLKLRGPDFNAARVARVPGGYVQDWSRWAGKPLCPIGLTLGGPGVLMVAPDGTFYLATDTRMAEMGRELCEAVERMVFQKPGRFIPDPEDPDDAPGI